MTKQNSPDAVRAKATELIRHKLFHPHKENDEIIRISEEFADLWPSWEAGGKLEADVNAWLKKLDLSHTGFWRGPGSGLPAYFAINAVLKRFEDGRLMFVDILPSGIAEHCGIDPGDVLLAVNGQQLDGIEPRFRLGNDYELILSRDGVEKTVAVSLPRIGPKDRPPMVEAKPLTHWIKDQTGVLKVTSFPGAVGFDLLRDLESALASFEEKKCDRLILDLRSNCGGGLSSVRFMSLLVPDQRLIGYSLTRLGRDRKMPSERRGNGCGACRRSLNVRGIESLPGQVNSSRVAEPDECVAKTAHRLHGTNE